MTVTCPRCHRSLSAADGGCTGLAFVGDVAYLACAGGARLYRADFDGETLANVQSLLVGAYGQLLVAEPGAGSTLWIAGRAGDQTQILRITLPGPS